MRGVLDVCADCCRKANHPNPVQSVQIFTSYGTFVIQGFDALALGEILRNICVPLSRFVDCSMMYKHMYTQSNVDTAIPPLLVRVRMQSRIVGIPVDSECTAEIIKMRLLKMSFKDHFYRLFLNGNPLQVMI